MKPFFLVMTSALLVWGPLANAASIAFDVTVDDQTAGEPLNSAPASPGVTNTLPTSVVSTGADASITVQNTSTDPRLAPMGSDNAILFSDQSDTSLLNLAFSVASEDARSSGKVAISFDVMMLSDEAVNNESITFAARGSSNDILDSGRIRADTTNSRAEMRVANYDPETGSFLNEVVVGRFDFDTVVGIEWVIDLDTGESTMSIDGQAPVASGAVLGSGYQQFGLGTNAAQQSGAGFDNFVIAIPEPGVVTLVGLGAIAIAGRRRVKA